MRTLASPIDEREFRSRYARFLASYRNATGDALMQRLEWRDQLHDGREVMYFGVPDTPEAVAALAWSDADEVWEWYGGALCEGLVWVPADLSVLPHHHDQIDLTGTVLWHGHTVADLFEWAEWLDYPISFSPWPTWVLRRSPLVVHLRSFSRRNRHERQASRFTVTWSHDVPGLLSRAALWFGESFVIDAYGLRERIVAAPAAERFRDWCFEVVTVADDRGPASETLLVTHREEDAALAYAGWDRWDARGASFAMMLELLRFMDRRELSKTYLMMTRSSGKRGWGAVRERRIAIATGARRDWF